MSISFNMNKLILWMKDDSIRTLSFEPNKVNVITGNSKTGKTAIMEIIDYCLCSSDSTISIENIGENVLWYGINFEINEKNFTIARGEYTKSSKLSKKYYFSQTGEIPPIPSSSISEDELKQNLEKEFSIDKNFTFNTGGSQLKLGSKISFRYLLIFNTISSDIIDHSKIFFDKLDKDRYRQAFGNVFDLGIGIVDIQNFILSIEIKKVNEDLKKLKKQKENITSDFNDYDANLDAIIKIAKENKVISIAITDRNECISKLKNLFESGDLSSVYTVDNEDLEKLKIEKQLIELKIIKLKRFQKNHNQYKELLENDAESIKPIIYLNKNFSNCIKNEEYKIFLDLLEKEFKTIKKEIKNKPKFELNVENKLDELQKSLLDISDNIDKLPAFNDDLKDDYQRLISLGEIKADFKRLLNNDNDLIVLNNEIQTKENELEKLKDKTVDLDNIKTTKISVLNEYIQLYLDEVKEALDEYSDYKSDFDYKNKTLKLRKSLESVTTNITSSSDNLFLHLCLFLGMHHLIIKDEIKHILPFLMIDQPSKPYYNNNKDIVNNEDLKKYDSSKVKNIFKLFDSFFENILKESKKFQIILFEHVEPNAWEGCKHIHLVEQFDGVENALIKIEN